MQIYSKLMLILAGASACCLGQQATVRVLSIRFQYPEPQNVDYAKPITLPLSVDTPPIPPGVQVREFQGTKQELINGGEPDSGHPGCVRYVSTPYRVTVNGAIHVSALDNPFWLKPNPSGFEDQHYVFVFEVGQIDSDRLFILKREDRAAYFSSGYEVILKAPESLRVVPPDNVKQYRENTLTLGNVLDQSPPSPQGKCKFVKHQAGEIALSQGPCDIGKSDVSSISRMSPT